MLRLLLVVLCLLVWLVRSSAALEVPLTVTESAGVERVDNPVASGVPIPQGLVTEPSLFRVIDAKGNYVLASIEPRAYWLPDRSVKWVTVHFLANLPAKGVAKYRLVLSKEAAPRTELVIDEKKVKNAIVVLTGPARFIVPTDRLGPFTQVSVQAEPSKKASEFHDLLCKPSSVVLVARNGESMVLPRPNSKEEFRAEVSSLDKKAYTQTAVVRDWAVEERGPGRAVIALKGTFSNAQAASLDFTARLYFYSGSALAQMTLSVVNRGTESFARFVGIDRLAVEVAAKVGDRVSMFNSGGFGTPERVTFCKDGQLFETKVGSSPIRLAQLGRDRLTLTTSDGRRALGQTSPGWVQVSGVSGVFTAGTRWFWQVYPAGVTVGADATTALELKSPDGERIDLYTGGAKTHFTFFHFAPPCKVPAGAIAAGTTNPLVGVCPADWYCQDTRVMGELYSTNPSLYDPKYRDLIAQYQAQIDRCLKTVVDNRPRLKSKIDEFGWLNFGSGLHHRDYVRETAAESWWDSNYYDFPHAVVLNFLRTANPANLVTAEEAALHLADLDICHSFPGDAKRTGCPRSGPVVGHFRNYTNGQQFMGHDAFTFYKNQSLYELYYLTGERWYREVGLMSSEFAMNVWGKGALRNLAQGIWGVLSAYRDTHDKRFLERAAFFVDKWGKPWQDANNGSFKDQDWMYGLVFEAYENYYRLTGDKQMPEYLVKALDALIAEYWKPGQGTGGTAGINLFGYGLGYEFTGDKRYLDKGLLILEKVAATGDGGDRVKTFAQNFRGSPYFLKYLTAGYQPKPILKPSAGTQPDTRAP